MAAGDLTTLESFRVYCPGASTADDALLEQLITAYSAVIKSWLGRDILTDSYDITKSGRGTFAMQLPEYPIQSVELVQIDGITIPARAAIGQTGHTFDEEQIMLVGYCFTRGAANVRIQFTAGYDAVPADIAQAANELIALRYKERDRIGHSSKSLAGETVSFITKDMPASVATLLKSWRKVAPI